MPSRLEVATSIDERLELWTRSDASAIEGQTTSR